jgi:uncharacterized membrane protein YjjP (DUF1212 family)
MINRACIFVGVSLLAAAAISGVVNGLVLEVLIALATGLLIVRLFLKANKSFGLLVFLVPTVTLIATMGFGALSNLPDEPSPEQIKSALRLTAGVVGAMCLGQVLGALIWGRRPKPGENAVA